VGVEGRGVKGQHVQLVEVDEAQGFAVDPAELLAEATSGLEQRLTEDPGAVMEAYRKAVERQLAMRRRPVTCPFCQGGVAFTPSSALWGHNCWVCGGWGVMPAGMQGMRGPFAPRPRRETV